MCSVVKTVSVVLIILSINAANQVTIEGKYEHYDLIVIGGGSGGLAAAKDAKKYGKRVLVVDYVEPSPRGTKWGLGGTCVNVGCIPKKLMHQAALVGEAVEEAKKYGWKIKDKNPQLDWNEMVKQVQHHLQRTWQTLSASLEAEGEDRIVANFKKGKGEFIDKNTIKVTFGGNGNPDQIFRGDTVLIAVGGRPSYPINEVTKEEVEGARKYGITSDDLFSLKESPGRTLIIGAGYIGLECAGFLRGMGMDVVVAVRSDRVLREFDLEMTKMIVEDLKRRGVKFLFNTKVLKITKNKLLHVQYMQEVETKDKEKVVLYPTDDFKTVLIATGRHAATKDLKLENVGIEAVKDGKLQTVNEQVKDNIYAVGDVILGGKELTPVAIHAAKLLMARLYNGATDTMDYDTVPTTVFTPLEYSFVGLSEDAAKKQHGEDNIEVYHTYYSPLEYSIPVKNKDNCYLKVVCLKEEQEKREGKEGTGKILGFHYLGPSAGEVMQGYAAALRAGITFKQLQRTVGIHPTVSEEFTRLYITKASGKSPRPQSCCS